MKSAVKLLAFIAVLAAGIAAPAQVFPVQVQPSPQYPRNLVVTNNTDGTIEAIHIFRHCGPTSSEAGEYDILNSFSPDNSLFVSKADNRSETASTLIRPHTSAPTLLTTTAEQNNKCDATVDGILLADGTSLGDPLVIRALIAERQGRADAIAFWNARLAQEPADGSSLAALRTVANQRQAIDRAALGQPDAAETVAANGYWRGRSIVDGTLLSNLPESAPTDPARRMKLLDDLFARWDQKLRNSQSYTIETAAFPLPANIPRQQ